MNVKIVQGGREINVEDLNIEPMTPGEFLAGIFNRRNMSSDEFRKASGLMEDEVVGLLADRVPLERPVTAKIDRALPGVSKLLVRMHEQREFYDRYGCMRPSSPVKRALVVARHKFELG
jgi:plasmid maintenance system antidote protein VapI